MGSNSGYCLWFDRVSKNLTPLVGGKTANLGELINKVGVPVPPFFAVTTKAYDRFIEFNGLHDKIVNALNGLDTHNVKQLQKVGKKVRSFFKHGEYPPDLKNSILNMYTRLRKEFGNVFLAVRSSATAEDLPNASFAGQQETFLNVHGEEELLEKIKLAMASLFTDRAISYRVDKGFNHFKVKLSVTVQVMVDSVSSGVAFTIDPDSGHNNFVFINGSWGLGELIVQGKVTPDEFIVFKPTRAIISKKLGKKLKKMVRNDKGNAVINSSEKERTTLCLTDEQIKQLTEYCVKIENHYKNPMDIEWAVNNKGEVLIVQARRETVHSVKKPVIETYRLKEKGEVLVTGKAVGRKISVGKVRVIKNVKGIHDFKEGEVLVTSMTDPDWEPIMKIASAIITDKGGSTSHAAIVSRELGVPAIVGTNNATKKLKNNDLVTVDCSRDVGKVLKGALKFEVKRVELTKVPKTRTKIMINLGNPSEALDLSLLPIDGVGLAREEFIIANIGEHPLKMIEEGRGELFVNKLAEGVGLIGAAFYPREVIVRFSDFKTNEYRSLRGGEEFEPVEENPMIGWRGASRYISEKFKPAFLLECEALKKVRNEWGLTNINVMIPFCRTVEEGKEVLKIMKSAGLKRGVKNLKVYVMAEIPSNIILANEFCKLFDGFSIGSNDLTQLTLGIDRDSNILSNEFDETNPAVLESIKTLINVARENKKYVGICGQAPSDHPKYVNYLVNWGISSISLNPDVVLETKLRTAKLERIFER